MAMAAVEAAAVVVVSHFWIEETLAEPTTQRLEHKLHKHRKVSNAATAEGATRKLKGHTARIRFSLLCPQTVHGAIDTQNTSTVKLGEDNQLLADHCAKMGWEWHRKSSHQKECTATRAGVTLEDTGYVCSADAVDLKQRMKRGKTHKTNNKKRGTTMNLCANRIVEEGHGSN